MAYTKDSKRSTILPRIWKLLQTVYQEFLSLAHPLNDLLKKDKKFIWSNKCQESFDLLKKCFTEEPVLMMPDHTRPFQIQVDLSLFATGGILTQMDTNGDHHPCAYLSKSLTKEQRKYDTGDRELLAIVHMLKEWRHYIQGSGHTTTILSDHDNHRHSNNWTMNGKMDAISF